MLISIRNVLENLCKVLSAGEKTPISLAQTSPIKRAGLLSSEREFLSRKYGISHFQDDDEEEEHHQPPLPQL